MRQSAFVSEQVRGWVGFFSGKKVRGWARWLDESPSRCELRIAVGEYSSDVLIADELREHLQQRDEGDGHFGFTFVLPTDAVLTGHEMLRLFIQPSGEEIFAGRVEDLEGGGLKEMRRLAERKAAERAALFPFAEVERADHSFGNSTKAFGTSTADESDFCGREAGDISTPPHQYLSSDTQNEAGLPRLRPASGVGNEASPHLIVQGYSGWVGAFASRRISGWVSSNLKPDEAQRIRIQVGSYKSDIITADEDRDHLAKMGRTSTKLGFSHVVPDAIPLKASDTITVLDCEDQQTGLKAGLQTSFEKFIDTGNRPIKRAKFPRAKQDDTVLLWCPISVSGLTTQLEQVTEILRYERIKYVISYHIEPSVDHPEAANWVDPKDIDSPKIVIYFERFVEFDRGFGGAFKVFYVNLDWLNDTFIGSARVHADVILAPVTYRQEFLEETFSNQKVIYLPWPSAIEPKSSLEPAALNCSGKLNVLYIGNDYSESSRKSPHSVVDAILNYQGTNLVFDLKFRSALPSDLKMKLEECPNVRTVIDYSTPREIIAELHELADVALIPNECEGNGLSILEAWAFGVVPAVLNGHPMINVASDESAFFIDCEQYGWREKTPVYKTSPQSVLSFFQSLSADEVQKRQAGVIVKAQELQARKLALRNVIRDLMKLGGLRNRDLRLQIEAAHLPASNSDAPQAQSLMFGTHDHSYLTRVPRLIDVILTTSQRPEHLKQSLPRLARAMELSPYKHRLFVTVDGLDQETNQLLAEYGDIIDVVMYTRSRVGLPFTWNVIRSINDAYTMRTEEAADYLCYIQDDCLINNPMEYFATMAEVASEASPGILGLVSGFHTEVHPGFAEGTCNSHNIIFSDTIDGKNFMGRLKTFKSIMPLTWWFADGMRRGNPGPVRGSHFDLWLWKESPNSLTVQKKINIIIPKLTSHIASAASESTWNNDTSDDNTKSRIEAGRVYLTRKSAESV